jgi:hypothetical protein
MPLPSEISQTSMGPDSLGDADHPTDISWSSLGPALVLSSLAMILVVLRWYTRVSIVGKVGVDDYFLTVAMVGAIAIKYLNGC